MIHTVERRKALAAFSELQPATVSAAGPHAITQVHAFAVAGSGKGSPYSVLQVDTRSGTTGYGECKPLSPADMKSLNDVLVGKSALAYEALNNMAPEPARGGLNMALLDIVGKVTKAPIYRVLGGPTRFKARAIAALSGSSDSELQADIQRHVTSGVRAFLIPIAMPTARNQGSLFIKTNVDRLKALQAAAPNADFAVGGGEQLTPGDAGSLAAALQSLRPLWFDEPCAVTNINTLHKISDESVVPLAFGRGIANGSTFQDLLREGVIDLVKPDLLLFGISGVCRIAAMAETYYVAVAPSHDAGPIATAAALHAAASMPNFFILQIPGSGLGSATIRDGFFELPKGPGLGITVDTKSFERNRIA
jgi:galactonate dehydratase